MVGNSQVIFEKAESSSLTLVGKSPEIFPGNFAKPRMLRLNVKKKIICANKSKGDVYVFFL